MRMKHIEPASFTGDKRRGALTVEQAGSGRVSGGRTPDSLRRRPHLTPQKVPHVLCPVTLP